jgi:hypothetical protein
VGGGLLCRAGGPLDLGAGPPPPQDDPDAFALCGARVSRAGWKIRNSKFRKLDGPN